MRARGARAPLPDGLKKNCARIKTTELQMLWKLAKDGEDRPLAAAELRLLMRVRDVLDRGHDRGMAADKLRWLQVASYVCKAVAAWNGASRLVYFAGLALHSVVASNEEGRPRRARRKWRSISPTGDSRDGNANHGSRSFPLNSYFAFRKTQPGTPLAVWRWPCATTSAAPRNKKTLGGEVFAHSNFRESLIGGTLETGSVVRRSMARQLNGRDTTIDWRD
jgi:hypothetical protein